MSIQTPCDRPADDEIEVTPEMIEAGVMAYYIEGSPVEDTDNRTKAGLFTAIIRAMIAAC